MMTDPKFDHLNYIGFQRIWPSRPLRPYVQCYWLIQSTAEHQTPRVELLHPNGGLGIVFNLGDDLVLDNVLFQNEWLLDSTPAARTRTLTLQGRVEAFGVRFNPMGAFRLFGVPVNELLAARISLTEIAQGQMNQLFDQIFYEGSLQDKVAYIDEWLLKRLAAAHEISPVVASAAHLLRSNHGQIAIPAVAEAVAISQRQLERLLKKQMGMSPKKYARVLRIQQTRQQLKYGRYRSLAEVGAAMGFYDQAHFVREFKSIVGMTPQAYLNRPFR